MYDPDLDFMFPELTAAHVALDAAVERAYGLQPKEWWRTCSGSTAPL